MNRLYPIQEITKHFSPIISRMTALTYFSPNGCELVQGAKQGYDVLSEQKISAMGPETELYNYLDIGSRYMVWFRSIKGDVLDETRIEDY